LDSIIDFTFGLEFQFPGIRGHAKVISSKVLLLADHLYTSEIILEEAVTNLPFLRQ